MPRNTLRLLAALFCCLTAAPAQTLNNPQQITLQGLLSVNNHGSLTAAAYAPDGSLILLLNQADGIRLLKSNATATTLNAQAHNGATGDIALAMSIDPTGNIYITGTSTSGALSGTTGVPFPSPTGTSTNGFLAKYDTSLNLLFLTFLGAGQTAPASVAATTDAVFVTGITFSSTFPVTPAGIQQFPAPNSSENGFVARFNATGTTLVYATYLTGANGTTAPTSIAADTGDNAYITGSTTSTGFPTSNALVPNMLGTTSGFLTAVSPTGSAFLYATYIPGNGLTGIALDPTTQTLLLTGNVAIGQFPIATVTAPLAETAYQTLLRLPITAQSVTSSVLLIPATQSFVTPGPNGDTWISGTLTNPLLPGAEPPDYPTGDTFLLHLTAANTFDQTLRIGGQPSNNPDYASLNTNPAAPAVSGTTIALPNTLSAITSSSLLATQRFDFPLIQTPTTVLPNTLTGILPNIATCPNSSQCTGTAALLTLLTTATSAPSLSLSTNNLPNIILRNQGSTAATGLAFTITGYTLNSNCGTTLQPSNDCTLALTGTGPGTLTASAANAPSYTLSLPSNTLIADSIALSTPELDFGIVTSTSPSATQTFSISNLNTTPQTFTSALDASTKSTTAYTLTQSNTTCTPSGTTNTYTLAANSTCNITLALTASNLSINDAAITARWLLGTHSLKLTAFTQAASLTLSASEIDFGTQYTNTPALNLPRYLYISNNSALAIQHTPATLPTATPFTLTDNCPTTLEPHTVCGLTLRYTQTAAPSDDSYLLTLDAGLTALLTGQTLQPTSVTGSTPNPNLTVSAATLTFATPVTVTAISGTTQTLTLTNNGTASFSLTTAITGDFLLTNACTATLAAKASCQLTIAFAPSQPGLRDGLISLTAGSGFAPTLITLSGTGSAILPANNGTLNLGQTYAGEPATAWFLIQQPLTSITATTNSPLFTVIFVSNTGTTPTTLPESSFNASTTAACANCYLGIQFLSQTPGTQTGTLTLTTVPGGNPYTLTLTATALPVQGLLLTPITQDFGPIPLGSVSQPLTFTLANLVPSSSGVTITSIATTGDFALTSNTSCTTTLSPTAACFLNITFNPTAAGPRAGMLTITTSTGTITSTLIGYGSPSGLISLNPTALTFQNTPGPTATIQTITVSNPTTNPVIIATPTTTIANFNASTTCATLAPAATCSITVQFIPTATTIIDTLTIPVTTTQNGQTNTTAYTVPLTAAYTSEDAGLEILPSQVNFGATATSTLGNTRQFTLKNLTAKQLTIALTMPRQFPLASANTCAALAPNASCTFTVSFLPAISSAVDGTVFAQGTPSDGSAPVQSLAYMLAYSTGAGALTITGYPIPNNALTFGQITSGQTAQQSLTLTNSSTIPVTLHRLTSEPPFLATTTCTTTLAPTKTCTVTLTYAPIDELPTNTISPTPRSDTGTLILESDAAISPQTVALAGSVTPILSSSPASSSILATYQLSQAALTFANTTIGNASTPQTITLTNTGTNTLAINSIQSSADFPATTTCTTLQPGATCTLTVQFTPTTASTSTLRTAALEILSNAATALDFITLLGTSSTAPLTLTPTTLNFGTLNVGTKATLPIQITNTTTAPIAFISQATTGDYTTASSTCPTANNTLAANATCIAQITFTPSTTGTRTGTFSLATNATTLPLTVDLTGFATASTLQITPGTLAFGPIDIGSPSALTLTLLNAGTGSVTHIATTITGTNAADFAVTAPCSTSTLAPNQGCTATITFTPSALGPRSATLTLSSSDPGSPTLIPLTGTGIAGGSFALTVSGSSTASQTVTSGSPAIYALTLTPINYTGTVALTCTPITAGPYATCSLLSSTLTLAGLPLTSTATLNTITSAGATYTLARIELPGVLFTLILFAIQRRRRILLALLLALILPAIQGCGSGTPASPSALRYTPAGTYQYTVTATATSGSPNTSTVTLNLIVQ